MPVSDLVLSCLNLLNNSFISPASIPAPVSEIATTTDSGMFTNLSSGKDRAVFVGSLANSSFILIPFLWRTINISTEPLALVNLRAFEIRLFNTCLIPAWSIGTSVGNSDGQFSIKSAGLEEFRAIVYYLFYIHRLFFDIKLPCLKLGNIQNVINKFKHAITINIDESDVLIKIFFLDFFWTTTQELADFIDAGERCSQLVYDHRGKLLANLFY